MSLVMTGSIAAVFNWQVHRSLVITPNLALALFPEVGHPQPPSPTADEMSASRFSAFNFCHLPQAPLPLKRWPRRLAESPPDPACSTAQTSAESCTGPSSYSALKALLDPRVHQSTCQTWIATMDAKLDTSVPRTLHRSDTNRNSPRSSVPIGSLFSLSGNNASKAMESPATAAKC